ncbi:hypothetical protein AMTR_s00020p00014330, partial [Amborella trichopoda]
LTPMTTMAAWSSMRFTPMVTMSDKGLMRLASMGIVSVGCLMRLASMGPLSAGGLMGGPRPLWWVLVYRVSVWLGMKTDDSNWFPGMNGQMTQTRLMYTSRGLDELQVESSFENIAAPRFHQAPGASQVIK